MSTKPSVDDFQLKVVELKKSIIEHIVDIKKINVSDTVFAEDPDDNLSRYPITSIEEGIAWLDDGGRELLGYDLESLTIEDLLAIYKTQNK